MVNVSSRQVRIAKKPMPSQQDRGLDRGISKQTGFLIGVKRRAKVFFDDGPAPSW
jgi:hypothetical protein